jgi:Protein of unknown function (DUF1573)
MMRSFFLACFCGLATLLCGQAIGPRIQFMETRHEFGELGQGEDVIHTFQFRNVGDAPLIIESAKTTCGCDVASWSREPIAPGEMGTIRYHYDSNRIGPWQKSTTVVSNDSTQPVTRLYCGGEIFPKGSLLFETRCLEQLLIPQGSTQPIAFPFRRAVTQDVQLGSPQYSAEVLSLDFKHSRSMMEQVDTVFAYFDTQTLGPFSNTVILQVIPSTTTEFMAESTPKPAYPEERRIIYLHFEGEIVGPEVMAEERKRR